MPVDFVGREVEVRQSEDEPPVLLSFRLASREYKVAEQIASWRDPTFGNLQRGRDWRQQQQRQYFRVRTEEGEVYELYADWHPVRRGRKGAAQGARWFLHRRLSSAAAKEAPKTEEEPKPPTE
jgi:hypothetical protein